MAERINQGIGHLKLNDIRPQHLNELYAQLSKCGLRESGGIATAKKLPDGGTLLAARLKVLGITYKAIAQKAGVATNTFANAVHGKNIAADKADAIAAALGESTAVLFDVQKNMQPLSNKTILEHHRYATVWSKSR